MYVVVVQKFTFAISSPDECLLLLYAAENDSDISETVTDYPGLFRLFIMAALWNRAGHYIFCPVVSSSIFLLLFLT